MIDIKKRDEAHIPVEYGCKFWRLLPWNNSENSDRGAALAIIDPNTSTILHSHEEEEVFYVLKGSGHMRIDDERTSIMNGDIIRVAPHRTHTIENTSTDVMEILCLWYPTSTDNEQPKSRVREGEV